MRNGLLILFLFIFNYIAHATHIVGGGFSYEKLFGNNYRFRLTLYFDYINGNPGAKDESPDCSIYSKSTNQLIDTLMFPLIDSSRFLPYTNPRCAIGNNIKTQVLIYEKTLFMPPASFSDPLGYYLVWERCCRNNVITNILKPQNTGQSFYMEFPPVAINGVNFANSSPQFQGINSDYPCINQAFSLSFLAVDPDGDSLVYSFTNPLKGNSDTARRLIVPPSMPGPYVPVNWRPGFNAQNAITGNPGLSVNSKNGLLTCVASQVGLFVFSVLCEEFRNGKKIGEVRREMQLNVKDCLPNAPPDLVVRNPLTNNFVKNADTLQMKSNSSTSCYMFKLTDAQFNQNVRFQVKSISLNTPSSLQKDTSIIRVLAGDSVAVRFCIPPCAQATRTNPWKILLIATDDGCSQPLSDSLMLYLVIKPSPTMPPSIETLGFVDDTISVIQTETFTFQTIASQTENGRLEVFSSLVDSKGIPIPIQTNGILLPDGTGGKSVISTFNWPEICLVPENQPLKLRSIVKSIVCDSIKYDTLFLYFRITPKVLGVGIESDYSGLNDILVLENTTIAFNLTGTVTENRRVNLSATGSLISLPGFSFLSTTGSGTTTSPFLFASSCSSPSGTFIAKFISSSTFCNRKYEDTISYNFRIKKATDSLGTIPNLLTANGDGKNDDFSINEILPQDNCQINFEFIEIYDRWGKKIFFSRDRNFNWKPDRSRLGVYFFALHFKEKTIRDWLTVIK